VLLWGQGLHWHYLHIVIHTITIDHTTTMAVDTTMVDTIAMDTTTIMVDDFIMDTTIETVIGIIMVDDIRLE